MPDELHLLDLDQIPLDALTLRDRGRADRHMRHASHRATEAPHDFSLLPPRSQGPERRSIFALKVAAFSKAFGLPDVWNPDRLPGLRPTSLAQRQSLRKIALKRQNRASPVGRTLG